jgi:hypothetical protein
MSDDQTKSLLDGELSDRLACASRPALACAARGWTFVLADRGSCYRLDRDGPPIVSELPELDGCSAVVADTGGTLHAGLYDGMIATLRGGEWDYRAADAPVLSLAATPAAVAIGDAAGRVVFHGPDGVPAGSAALGEPVGDLAAGERGLLALGVRGSLWRIAWPENGAVAVTPLPPRDELGRPVGLAGGLSPWCHVVFSAERMATVDERTGRVTIGWRRFPDGIGTVIPLGRGADPRQEAGLGLLTDAGQVWRVTADLKTAWQVLLPDTQDGVTGIAPGPEGTLFAWTARALHRVGLDRTVRTFPFADVALVIADPAAQGQFDVVHWQPDRGVQVRRVRSQPQR